jgi:DNA-binding winged helix-turn-helix (wHTH) protein/Flp pilus assembly protein TadD
MAMLATQQSDAIRLAGEPPFCLGSLAVTPALRQVMWNGESRTIEPRVMQVLVALAREPGAIVSRDSLVERCWEGRIVGENAIQRVISLLRHLAAASGAFEVETITKVGYRLKIQDAPRTAPRAVAPEADGQLDRRALIAGGGAALMIGAAGLWFGPLAADRREALRLHAAGLEVQQRGGSLNVRQAISYFRRAVAFDPRNPQIWSDLARARFALLEYFAEQDHDPVIAGIRNAAGRALALDPDNRQALVMLTIAGPIFRNWISVHRTVEEALRRFPDDSQMRERAGLLKVETGQWRAALIDFRRLLEREPLVPDHSLLVAGALWQLGNMRAAEALLERAARLWPGDPRVWLARFHFALLGGRPHEALAMTTRPAAGMGGASPLPASVATSTAQALVSGSPVDKASAVTAILAARKTGAASSFIAVPYLVALDALDHAWEVLHTYYLGKRDPVSGERRPLPTYAWRRTNILFTAQAAPLRADPRFARITATLGLDAYWRATGTRPDYRAG